ncbi:MAG TPA: helix-turn-helix domain-containing protein [Patescibacteria group bacterium]|nr:helix-turn-helix domain-containing protein [Patescibacteria group bacterium]
MIKAGQRLQDIRLEKGLSLEEVAQKTKIRANFLAAIEKGDYSKLPSVAYAQGFVRNYASFLKLPEKEILALFRREFDEKKHYHVLPHGFTKNKEYSPSKIRIRQSAILIFLIFAIVLGFIGYQYRSAFFGPSVYIINPEDNAVVNSKRVTILGKTDPNATVMVEEFSVSVDTNGEFKKVINVFPGKTTIVIKVTNKFGRETVVRKIIQAK